MQKSGTWLPATPIPNTVLVNTGDLMMRYCVWVCVCIGVCVSRAHVYLCAVGVCVCAVYLCVYVHACI